MNIFSDNIHRTVRLCIKIMVITSWYLTSKLNRAQSIDSMIMAFNIPGGIVVHYQYAVNIVY